MNTNKAIGAFLAVFAVCCLFLTGWIIHKSGVMQGATDDGQWALGLAAIAVHLSIAVFGLAMFGSRRFLVKVACGVIMLGAAACSAWQITSFLATEVISVTKAREMKDQRESARVAAAIELAKQRQKTQAELAKSQLKWFQGTTEETRGRLSRKDYMESGNKLIVEIGKADVIELPETKTETAPLQAGLLAQWVARRLGWDETALQASPYLLIALMLLLIEVISWPLASYFWNKPTEIVEAEEAPADTISSSPKGGSGNDEGSGGKVKSEPETVTQDEKVVNFPAAMKTEPAQFHATPKVSAEPARVSPPAPSLSLQPPRRMTLAEILADYPSQPSQKALAAMLGKSEATVSRELKRLEGRGKVKRTRKGRAMQITRVSGGTFHAFG